MDVVGGWISEIRYFYVHQSMEPLSAHAQALWHYLMYRANNTFWSFPLVIRVTELSGALNMSVSAVKKARAELVKGGYLLHERQQGNQAARYFILSNIRPGKVVEPLKVLPGGKEKKRKEMIS